MRGGGGERIPPHSPRHLLNNLRGEGGWDFFPVSRYGGDFSPADNSAQGRGGRVNAASVGNAIPKGGGGRGGGTGIRHTYTADTGHPARPQERAGEHPNPKPKRCRVPKQCAEEVAGGAGVFLILRSDFISKDGGGGGGENATCS